ncbi:hypothetical protein Y032_0403g823 [Ancylostoma ceylanicum]|nr:hypothetical protein Y032_0403g823 [Ancylostoma ceylanicum]
MQNCNRQGHSYIDATYCTNVLINGTILRILLFSNVEKGTIEELPADEEKCERMRAGGYAEGCFGLAPDIYCIVASGIILGMGILIIVLNHGSWMVLVAGIVLAVLAIVSAILLIIGGEFTVAVIVALILVIVAVVCEYDFLN